MLNKDIEGVFFLIILVVLIVLNILVYKELKTLELYKNNPLEYQEYLIGN